MRKYLLLVFVLLVCKFSIAQESQEEINVLFLGNSYTYVNNLPEMINELAKESGKIVKHESVCPGGCTFFQHVDSPISQSKIREGKWDFVVLQEQSQLPSIDYYRHNSMRPNYQILYDTIMHYNPNAKVVGYMTWGRQYGGQQCVNYGEGLYCSADFVDFNHMQDTMSAAYCENAYATDSWVAPVGDAWKEAFALDSTLILHSNDESHPNYEGSYLAACVFYSVFFKESPIDTYHSESISDEKALLLQTVANDVVFNNLEKWNIEIGTIIDSTNIDTTFIDTTNIVTPLKVKNYEIINNPNDDNLIIKNNDKSTMTIKIFDINGSMILKRRSNDDEIFTFPNSKGVFIIQLFNEQNQNRFIEKIIKQ